MLLRTAVWRRGRRGVSKREGRARVGLGAAGRGGCRGKKDDRPVRALSGPFQLLRQQGGKGAGEGRVSRRRQGDGEGALADTNSGWAAPPALRPSRLAPFRLHLCWPPAHGRARAGWAARGRGRAPDARAGRSGERRSKGRGGGARARGLVKGGGGGASVASARSRTYLPFLSTSPAVSLRAGLSSRRLAPSST